MNSEERFKTKILTTVNDDRTILIRLVVGLVFLTEGIQKFLFPELLGTGRFSQIGFSHPAFFAYFTGTFEIICITFILLGLFTRLVSIPLFIIIMVAFITTKWPILLNKSFWAMAHEYRSDFTMTLLLVYFIIYGGGRWSLDSIFFKALIN